MVSSPACCLPIPQLHSRQLFEVTAKLLYVTREKGKTNETFEEQRVKRTFYMLDPVLWDAQTQLRELIMDGNSGDEKYSEQILTCCKWLSRSVNTITFIPAAWNNCILALLWLRCHYRQVIARHSLTNQTASAEEVNFMSTLSYKF